MIFQGINLPRVRSVSQIVLGVSLCFAFGGAVIATPLSVEAEHDLGVQYLKGDGVPEDKVRGRQYIQQSALRGYPLAQFHIGLLFYRGDGGENNLACAKWWFNQAAQSNDEAGQLAAQALAEIPNHLTLPVDNRFLLANIADEARCTRLPNDAVTESSPDTSPSAPLASELVLSEPILDGAPQSPLPSVDDLEARAINTSHGSMRVDAVRHRVLSQINSVINRTVQPRYDQWQAAFTQFTLQRYTLARENARQKGQSLLIETPRYIAQHSRVKPAWKTMPAMTPSAPVIPPAAGLSSTALRQPDADVSSSHPPKYTTVSTNLGRPIAQASKQHYTLQLSSASEPKGLHETARRFQLSNYLVYQTVRHGREWHVLVYGEYADITTAKQAIKQLPAHLQRNQPWVHRIQQVQAELPKSR